MKIVSLIPLLPLLGFLIIGLFGKNMSKSLVGIIGSGSVLGAFIIALLTFFNLNASAEKSFTIDVFSWISAGSLKIPFSFLIDPLSCLFLLIITGIGFLIHVYSAGYMHDDEGFHRFFAYLNLFIFFMLLLVMGSNYLIMFVGWEGVGLCSYLLIGFWFKNTAYNNAAKKAFVVNRIGDLGFLLGIILMFVTFGSISFGDVFSQAGHYTEGNTTMTAIALLLFIGAMGKSAQIPLYTWLPDAMAGPTPVSALIHAATMVTAGIYMVARSNIIYTLSPVAMAVVAGVGLFTCIFAATIGLFQNDIKKVLAYSTVSQLGLMFLGLGVGAYVGAVFHVMTHAFFKALLFLGAGSVIHAMSGEQDIRKMGGLKKHLPVTYVTFLIGTLAIAGIPGLSGFFSKDEILAHTYAHSSWLWMFGVLAAGLTAFYMFRLFFLTFLGGFRGTQEQHHHLHESPKSMTVPLMILAVFSIIGGYFGFPHVLGGNHWLEHYLEPSFSGSIFKMKSVFLSHETEYMLMGLAVAIALGAIYLAYNFFVVRDGVPAADHVKMNPVQKVIYNKYYVDELYEMVITKPINGISNVFSTILDTKIVDGIVNGIGQIVTGLSSVFRLLQTGNTGFYVLMMVVSIAAILFVTMF